MKFKNDDWDNDDVWDNDNDWDIDDDWDNERTYSYTVAFSLSPSDLIVHECSGITLSYAFCCLKVKKICQVQLKAKH